MNIKFRAWDNIEKRMYSWENIRDGKYYSLHDFFFYPSKDKIIMQFSGAVDGNGKEIYEGDILYYCPSGKSEAEFVQVVNVEFDSKSKSFGWYVKSLDRKIMLEVWLSIYNCHNSYARVSGNIYENSQ